MFMCKNMGAESLSQFRRIYKSSLKNSFMKMILQLFFLDSPLLLVIILIAILTGLYYYRHVLYGIRNFMVFKSLTKETQEKAETTRKSFECPRCGRDMQQGYLVSQRPIFWSNQALLTPFTFSRVPTFSPHLSSSLVAYRCASCGIIYVDARQNLIPDGI